MMLKDYVKEIFFHPCLLLPSTFCSWKWFKWRTLNCNKLARRIDGFCEILIGPNVVTPKGPTKSKCKVSIFLRVNRFVKKINEANNCFTYMHKIVHEAFFATCLLPTTIWVKIQVSNLLPKSQATFLKKLGWCNCFYNNITIIEYAHFYFYSHYDIFHFCKLKIF